MASNEAKEKTSGVSAGLIIPFSAPITRVEDEGGGRGWRGGRRFVLCVCNKRRDRWMDEGMDGWMDALHGAATNQMQGGSKEQIRQVSGDPPPGPDPGPRCVQADAGCSPVRHGNLVFYP